MNAVILGSDHAGLLLKDAVRGHLEAQGFACEDVGTTCAESCDYPLYAKKLCERVLATGSQGILVCGTGIGMSMAANRFKGVRAALCYNELAARMARQHNDANVLCLGERVLGPGLALAIVDAFVATAFEGGRHQRRVDLFESFPGDLF